MRPIAHALERAVIVAAALLAFERTASAQATLLQPNGTPIPAMPTAASFTANIANTLPPNDDGSSAAIALAAAFPQGFCFVNRPVTQMFVNNNGNVTLNAAVPTFTPIPFPITNNPMMAPWWADVDTRGAATAPENRIYWDLRLGRITATWYRVGYFNAQINRRNSFQIIIQSSAVDAGMNRADGNNYDIEYRYNDLTWYVGQASGGNATGTCDMFTPGGGCTPAQAGFDGGDLSSVVYLPNSRTPAILNLTTSSNVGSNGVWRFPVRNCGAPGCGNGTVDPGEECDDGNTVSRDGCSNTCRSERANGATCNVGTQCRSGNCIDGVCCDTACNGQCEACALPGRVGTCSAVTGTPVSPRTACTGSGACAGTCNGTNRTTCTNPTTCSVAGCLVGTCNAGNCTMLRPQCALPLVCEALSNTCIGCTSNAQCSAPTPLCDTMTARCVACRNNADCGGSTPVCEPTRRVCVACTTNANCSGATPICDTTSNTCVGCRTAADCSAPTPLCGPTRQCVQCTSNANCSGATRFCDLTSYRCVGCNSNADCGGTTPYCNASRTCVACRNSADCSGGTPICDGTTSTCRRCASNSECPSSQPICDTMSGACRGCASNSDCRAPTPVCDTMSGVCRGCNSSADCSAPTPVCEPSRRVCVNCATNADCSGSTPLCDPGTNTCVACRTSADCSGGTPVCEPTRRVCVGCVASTDCSGTTPICDLTANRCVNCRNDGDCSGMTPVCEPTRQQCVTCTNNMHCAGSTPICNTTTNVCRGCSPMSAAMDCPMAVAPFCSTMGSTSGTCVSTPPVVTNPMNGSSSTDTRPIVRGTAAPGATVRVYIDGVAVGDATADGSGNWSFALTSGLSGGMHTAAAANVSGTTVGPQGTSVSFTVTMCASSSECRGATPVCDGTSRLCRPCDPAMATDCSAPRPMCASSGANAGRCVATSVTITEPANGSMTGSRRPDIRGVGAPNSTVAILIDGMEVGRASTDADGNFTFTPTMDLNAGMHTIAGAPVTGGGADAGADGGTTGMPGASITFTITTCTTSAECGGGTPICDSTTRACRGCDPMREAMDCPSAMLPMCATMGANAGRCVVRPPVITSPVTGAVVTSKRPMISGTGTPGEIVVITVNGAEVGRATVDAMGNWTFTPDRDLPSGMVTVGAAQVDAMGMVQPPASTVVITVPECLTSMDCAAGRTCDVSMGRCVVSMGDAGTDGAADGGSDASVRDGSAGDASMDASTGIGVLSGDGLCGCRAPGRSRNEGSSAVLLTLGGLALALSTRRRAAR